MKIYFDNCCLNRPFDDQLQIRIRLETEAKLKIQDGVSVGSINLVWSYVLDYENSKNPFEERRKQIHEWRNLASFQVQASDKIIEASNYFLSIGMRKFDALHIACAIEGKCDYFLTTDDKVLSKDNEIDGLMIIDPFGFIKEVNL
ncbi:MAG: PIN domain protein [Candidatus Anammoxibacter sp.]